MLKPDSLRAALTAVVPDLQRNPANLAIFIDEGKVAARMAAAPDFPNAGFEYRYRLTALLIELHETAPDAVMLAVVSWLHEHQPDLLQRHDQSPIDFQAEVIDDQKIDLVIRLQLSEAVKLRPRAGGGHDLVHDPEPAAIDEFDGVPRWTPLRQVWLDGQLILGDPD